MPHDFWTSIIHENSSPAHNIEISSPAPFCWQIRTRHLLSTEVVGKLLYAIYHQLRYLFDYLDYQIKIAEESPPIAKNIFKSFVNLALFPRLFIAKRKKIVPIASSQK